MTAAQNSRKQRARPGPGRPWKPGESGNPGGRPKESKTFKKWCRDVMEQIGRDAILAIAQTADDERVRFNAWRLITEYAYGKPTETLQVEREIEGTSRASDAAMAELVRTLNRMRDRLRPPTYGVSPVNGSRP